MKHRSTACELIEAGHVRINRARASKPSQSLKEGDVLTLALRGEVRVVKVLGEAERRGSANDARVLYEDIAAQQSSPSLPGNIGA